MATSQVQRCTLLSIKTGGCPETCTYCSQSSSWRKKTGLKAEKLMDLEEVYQVCSHKESQACSLHCSPAGNQLQLSGAPMLYAAIQLFDVAFRGLRQHLLTLSDNRPLIHDIGDSIHPLSACCQRRLL